MNDLLSMMNNYLNVLWFVLLIGMVRNIIQEREFVLSWFHHPRIGKHTGVNSKEQQHRRMRNLLYTLGGVLMVLMAWAMVITLARYFYGVTNIAFAGHSPSNMFTPFRNSVGDFAVLGVIGFIMAGTCFTLSAGERWLVNTGKLLTIITIIGLAWLYVFAALG